MVQPAAHRRRDRRVHDSRRGGRHPSGDDARRGYFLPAAVRAHGRVRYVVLRGEADRGHIGLHARAHVRQDIRELRRPAAGSAERDVLDRAAEALARPRGAERLLHKVLSLRQARLHAEQLRPPRVRQLHDGWQRQLPHVRHGDQLLLRRRDDVDPGCEQWRPSYTVWERRLTVRGRASRRVWRAGDECACAEHRLPQRPQSERLSAHPPLLVGCLFLVIHQFCRHQRGPRKRLGHHQREWQRLLARVQLHRRAACHSRSRGGRQRVTSLAWQLRWLPAHEGSRDLGGC